MVSGGTLEPPIRNRGIYLGRWLIARTFDRGIFRQSLQLARRLLALWSAGSHFNNARALVTAGRAPSAPAASAVANRYVRHSFSGDADNRFRRRRNRYGGGGRMPGRGRSSLCRR